jgi:hypothetical protein
MNMVRIQGPENWDAYGVEADLFEHDVHILILATLLLPKGRRPR